MPYSLVSAATLGFDLVRLPAGRSVAEVLLPVWEPTPTRCPRSPPRTPAVASTREQRGVLAVRSRRAREMAAAVPHLRGAAAAAGDRAAVLVEQLERGTIGDAPTLERLLRDDVLGPRARRRRHPRPRRAGRGRRRARRRRPRPLGRRGPPPAGPARADRALRPRRSTAALATAPPVGADLGAAGDDVAELLDAVRALDEAGRAAWRAAVDEGRADHRPWATAMHEASWAAHVSGRTRVLARGPAARRPGVPRRRLRPVRRRVRYVERARRLRPGDGDGRPAGRGIARRPPRALAAGHRHPLNPRRLPAGHRGETARQRSQALPRTRATNGVPFRVDK